MKRDLDELLRDALRKAGDSHRPEHTAPARAEFVRRLRRRRIFFGGSLALAGAGAAALVALFVMNPPQPSRDETDVAGPRGVEITAQVEVGESPDGVTVAGRSVWVANRDDGTVTRIDSRTDEATGTIDVGGRPEDLAVTGEILWVGDSRSGRLLRLDASSGERIGSPVEIPDAEGESLDLGASPNGLWVVSPSSGVNRVDASTGEVVSVATDAQAPSDVTVGRQSVWVLDDENDSLVHVDELSGNQVAVVPLEDPVAGANGDIALGGGGVWLADGSTRSVFRVDLEAGVKTAEVPFSGSYAALAVSPTSVWVLTGSDSGSGGLMLIDPRTGVEEGEVLPLSGSPLDLAVGSDALWVTGGESNLVTRIERVAQTPERARGEVASDAVPDDELVYVYASEGDIFGKEADGSIRTLISTPEFEARPAWVADNAIVFQRGGLQTPASDVQFLSYDLTTGEETSLGSGGRQAALGPDGRAAWVVPSDDPNRQTELSAGPSREIQRSFFAGNPDFEPLEVDNLEWDASGTRLYYEAGYDFRTLYVADVDTGDGESPDSIEVSAGRPLAPPEPKAAYLGPSSRSGDEVVVVKACCRNAGGIYRGAELGRLEFTVSGPAYTKIAGLDDVGFNVNFQDVTLEQAGGLDVESNPPGGPQWTITSTRSWLLSDGRALWLVDEEGEVDRLVPENVDGAAVNPALTG